NFGSGHRVSLSVRGDYEDGHVAQLAEDVGDLVLLPIIPPDHPDPAARRRRGEHLEGAVLALLKAEDLVERGLDLFRRETVSVDLLQVPLDPLELPHARAPRPRDQGVKRGSPLGDTLL